MNNKTKITLCYIALIASILFLAIGVDYFPHAVCWTPLVVSVVFALRCRVFYEHINNWLDAVIPID